MNKILEQITEKRESLGISQKDLSELSGVSLRTINAVERGKANPSLDVLSKILEPLGLKFSLSERVVND